MPENTAEQMPQLDNVRDNATQEDFKMKNKVYGFVPFRFTPYLPVVVPTSGHVQCIWVKGVYFHSKGCQPGAVGKILNCRKDS